MHNGFGVKNKDRLKRPIGAGLSRVVRWEYLDISRGPSPSGLTCCEKFDAFDLNRIQFGTLVGQRSFTKNCHIRTATNIISRVMSEKDTSVNSSTCPIS